MRKAAGREEGKQRRMFRTQRRDCMSPKLRAYAKPHEGLCLGEARLTSDKSPVRESRTPGSVGEASGNRRLYPTIFPKSYASVMAPWSSSPRLHIYNV